MSTNPAPHPPNHPDWALVPPIDEERLAFVEEKVRCGEDAEHGDTADVINEVHRLRAVIHGMQAPRDPADTAAWNLYRLCNPGPGYAWDEMEWELRERFRGHVKRYTADPSTIPDREGSPWPAAAIREAIGLPETSAQ